MMFSRASVVSLHLVLLCEVASSAKVSKNSTRNRQCLDFLEQMFGRPERVPPHSAACTLGVPEYHLPVSGTPCSREKSWIPVNFHSLSPWAYRISHDPAWYPRFIPEAYCMCKGCPTGSFGQESDQYRRTCVHALRHPATHRVLCRGAPLIHRATYLAVGATRVPLLEKDRDAQSSKQSLERAVSAPMTRMYKISMGSKAIEKELCNMYENAWLAV